MTRPLPNNRGSVPDTPPSDSHPGLWFDKFCNRWHVRGTSWTMQNEKGDGSNPKLGWINSLTTRKVGTAHQIDECADRLMRLIDSRGGRSAVFTTESRFVTGLGRSHPVENGFAWHPTLGTPYLPGSSVKGLLRAWAKLDADSSPSCNTVVRLLGNREEAGGVSFLDAVPITSVQLEADVMTPHYAGWTKDDPPGDWRSPTPIPFLVTAAATPFLFSVIPCRPLHDPDDLNAVMSWLCSALLWAGAGAKTAVGYGRFGSDNNKTTALLQRLRDQDTKDREQERIELEASQRDARLATLSPVEREIEELLDDRQDRNMPEVTAVLQAVESGRWGGTDKVEAAEWLKHKMQEEKRWKETSRKKNPAKDRDYQHTLRVKDWLDRG